MPWNCEDNPKLRRRSRLKRIEPARPKPEEKEDKDDETSSIILAALSPYPEAKRAVIRALYKQLGRPGEYDDGSECP